MSGGANDDMMTGESGDDDMFGGDGDDILNGDNGGDLLNGGNGGDKLFGGAGNDTLVAGAGADRLDGGTGADVMTGGLGNEIYVVDAIGDRTIEVPNGGYDYVHTYATYTVAANIEVVIMLGNAAINGYGNAAANRIGGNGNANKLLGLAGNDILGAGDGDDTLIGGLGRDTLWGDGGEDIFVFNSRLGPAHIDTIYDFDRFDDTIQLSNAIFKTVGANGALKHTALKLGKVATQADDRIIYDNLTGKLFYDSDGTGSAAQIHFATLLNKPGIVTASDFVII